MCPPLMIIDQPHHFAWNGQPSECMEVWRSIHLGYSIKAVTAFQVTDHDTHHHDGSDWMPDTVSHSVSWSSSSSCLFCVLQ